MTIANAIENAKNKIKRAYQTIENMGGTLPTTQNLNNLPTAIESVNTTGSLIDGSVTEIDTNVTSMRSYAFANCTNLNKVILRSNTVVDLSNDTIFENTPIENKTGSIYVSNTLLGRYKIPEFNSSSTSIQGLNYLINICAIYDGTKFVCVGDAYEESNTLWVYSSIGGVNWNSISEIYSSSGVKGLAYGNGYYLILSKKAGSSGKLHKSQNATTWAQSSFLSETNINWTSLTFGNNKFIAISKEGYVTFSDSDGNNWSQPVNLLNTSGTSYNWQSIAYGNGRYVAISNEGAVKVSGNGQTWTSISSLPTGSSSMWLSISYDNSKFIVTGSYTKDSYSGVLCYTFLFDEDTTWSNTNYTDVQLVTYSSASSPNNVIIIGDYGAGLVSDSAKYNFLPISQLS